MDNLIVYPQFQAFDSNGDPLSGGLVYTYEAGTSTPLTTYSDRTLSTPNANPVVLDSRGEATIYCNTAMKIVLADSDDTTIWTMDNIYPRNAILSDADSDTLIQVEESTDEDVIRMDIAGTEKAVLDSTGLIVGTPGGVTADGTLHVFTDSAGSVTANAAGDDLVVEGATNPGMSFLSPNDQTNTILFGDADDNDVGSLQYDHSADTLAFGIGTSEVARMTSAIIFVNETANAGMTQGITINQGANDNEIIALKSTDVGHNITDQAEADTFGSLGKNNPTDGGLLIEGYTDGTIGMFFRAIDVTADTTDPPTTSSSATYNIEGGVRSGTDGSAHGATGNLFQVTNWGTNAFVIKGDGEIYSNESATVGTFDNLDDTKMLADIRSALTGIKEGFITANRDWLVENKFMSHDGMLSLTKMMWLKVGALMQQDARITKLEQKLLEA